MKTLVYSTIKHQVEERKLSDYWLANNNNNSFLFIPSVHPQKLEEAGQDVVVSSTRMDPEDIVNELLNSTDLRPTGQDQGT